VAPIVVESEEEAGEGWRFVVRIVPTDGLRRQIRIEMTLSWADYDFWSGGMRSPSDVAIDVMKFIVARSKESEFEIPGRFDASIICRLFPCADDALRGNR